MIVFSASAAKSFTFDLWESGERKDEIMEKAKKNGIWLYEGGRSYRGKNFVLSNKLEYQTILFSEKADICLYFTNKTNILYMIEITWDKTKEINKADDLYTKMQIMLDKKYKEKNESHGQYQGYMRNGKEYKYCKYTLKTYQKENIELRFNECDYSIIANYKDEFFQKKNTEEEIQINYIDKKDEAKF